MGLAALTTNDHGDQIVPQTQQEWRDWISASATRNYVVGDPLLDWLNLYGEDNGFLRDTALPDYDPRTDFTEFVFRQARLFEESVVRHLRTLVPILTVAYEREHIFDLGKAEETFAAMRVGVPIICQGVFRDPEHRIYGAPDLLVRSDVLRQLFPAAIPEDEVCLAGPDLGRVPWHYRVVDIKFRTLGLLASGLLNNAGAAPAYKVQLFLYNRMLGRLQGFEPPCSYLLGRGWKQGDERGFNCLERIAPVVQGGTLARRRPIDEAVWEAVGWVRRVQSQGVKGRQVLRP